MNKKINLSQLEHLVSFHDSFNLYYHCFIDINTLHEVEIKIKVNSYVNVKILHWHLNKYNNRILNKTISNFYITTIEEIDNIKDFCYMYELNAKLVYKTDYMSVLGKMYNISINKIERKNKIKVLLDAIS